MTGPPHADTGFHHRLRVVITTARDVIARLEQVAAVTPSPMLHVHLRYARAVLSDDSAAGPLYADVMAQDLTCWPWAKARAELAYGSWLHRRYRHTEAREVLREAAHQLDGGTRSAGTGR